MDASFARAAVVAARQHGRVTTAQLHRCGIGRSGIEKGVRAGRLHRVHVGVYALGHLAPSRDGDRLAAVLACGPGAALCGRHAAHTFEIHDRWGSRIDVAVPARSGRRRPGIAVHHFDLLPFELTTCRNIPITTPSRTTVDLAHELRDEERIEWALRQLQYRRLYDRKLLELSLRRRPNRTLARLLGGIAPTRSPLEIAFLHRVVRPHHLPTPEVNDKVCGITADFWWPASRVIVETDGGQHDNPLQGAADEARDAIHTAAGILVLRYRWADVHAHQRTAAEISRQLRLRHLQDV